MSDIDCENCAVKEYCGGCAQKLKEENREPKIRLWVQSEVSYRWKKLASSLGIRKIRKLQKRWEALKKWLKTFFGRDMVPSPEQIVEEMVELGKK